MVSYLQALLFLFSSQTDRPTDRPGLRQVSRAAGNLFSLPSGAPNLIRRAPWSTLLEPDLALLAFSALVVAVVVVEIEESHIVPGWFVVQQSEVVFPLSCLPVHCAPCLTFRISDWLLRIVALRDISLLLATAS